MNKIIINAMRDKLLNYFDEQEALKEAIEWEADNE